MYSGFAVIALLILLCLHVDLITVTVLNITCFFKVSNKPFKYNTYTLGMLYMKLIMLGNITL